MGAESDAETSPALTLQNHAHPAELVTKDWTLMARSARNRKLDDST